MNDEELKALTLRLATLVRATPGVELPITMLKCARLLESERRRVRVLREQLNEQVASNVAMGSEMLALRAGVPPELLKLFDNDRDEYVARINAMTDFDHE